VIATGNQPPELSVDDRDGSLTAVEDFVAQKERGELRLSSNRYERLLPATQPRPGQQYAFRVDLDRCSGCKACVTACHSLNGLDEGETWRDVGLLVGGTSALPVLQHVTSACHHCLDPACLTACPVDAYEKDPVTGIVKHLDDQCFGCRYCTLACPYDVPKYNRAKGIVRKCDLCSGRLAAGEAPACVQACPQEAISIRLVETDQVIEDSEANLFLPGAPEPHITYPTTVYETKRVFPRNTLPADFYSVHPEQAHWPLVAMLVLTQLSVGAFLAALAAEPVNAPRLFESIRPLNSVVAITFGLLALATSVFHLGRPQYAFRAVIGLKHSWLSREIVAFGIFAILAVVYAATNLTTPSFSSASRVLAIAVAVTGIVGVACSVFVYAVTRRALWSAAPTATRFLFTTALLGLAAFLVSLVLAATVGRSGTAGQLLALRGKLFCQALMVVASAKLAFETVIFRHLRSRSHTPFKRSARLMVGPLSNATLARFGAGLLGGLVMPAFLLERLREPVLVGDFQLALTVVMAFAACLIGEVLERYLFFAAVAAPRMPGIVRD
jgi:Fe-S-cluster-containing dehydrogenase component/DMSO reductase anchor subunit